MTLSSIIILTLKPAHAENLPQCWRGGGVQNLCCHPPVGFPWASADVSGDQKDWRSCCSGPVRLLHFLLGWLRGADGKLKLKNSLTSRRRHRRLKPQPTPGASLSGTFLQTPPELVTPLKGRLLSTDAVKALRKVWVIIRPWKSCIIDRTAPSIIFVATNTNMCLSRQNTSFVATKLCSSR